MLSKLFIPPLVPFALLVGLCVWVRLSPSEFIDGQLDNAPFNAAGLLLFVSPVYFLLCFFLNAIDSCFDEKGGGLRPWLWSLFFCGFLVSILIWGKVGSDESGTNALTFTAFLVAVTILPMSLTRRLFGHRSGASFGSLWSRFIDTLGEL